MDVKSQLLENFPSTAASIFWDRLTKPGEEDCRILPTSWLKLRPQGGEVPKIPIITGEDVSMKPITFPILPVVLSLAPVLLTCKKSLGVHALANAVSTTISFIPGIRSTYGVNLIAVIFLVNLRVRQRGQDMDGLVTQQFCSKISVASVSNCFQIACKIALRVTCDRCV